jgi:hypothetical protein
MIRDTSIQSYRDVLGELSSRQQEVYDFIKAHGSVCNLDISDGLQKPINEVTPRVCELRTMKLVVEDGKRSCRTGKKVYFWRVNDEAPARVQFVQPAKRVAPVEGEFSFVKSWVA